jgi:site-specific DNA recombinase
MTPITLPTKPLGYVRLSDLRTDDLDLDGTSPSLGDQQKRIRDWCSQRGWPMPEILVENDLTKEGKPKPASAYKRRKIKTPDGKTKYRVIRPVFRQMVDRLESGRNDGLVALDLDRACRDPRDLEDLIDLAEQYGRSVESVTGSLRLTSDADITMARVLVAFANKSSRDKARRVSAWRERQANAGKFGGGRRPYGFEDDGLTRIEEECAVIRDAAYAILRGATLRGLARDLNTRKVPTVTGNATWTAPTLRDILIRPRNKGAMVYQGEEIATAPWEPIVPADVHDRTVALLTDEKRDTRAGTAPRWLLSGIARCGREGCGSTMEITMGGRAPRYRCKARPHLSRNQEHTDKLVITSVLTYLRENMPSLFVSERPKVDLVALREERRAILENLEALAADAALDKTGLMRGQLRRANERAAERLSEIAEAELEAAGPDPALADLGTAADPWKVWEGLGLERQRLVIDTLATVTILPTGRSGRGFDPESVRIEPKGQPVKA